MKIIPLILLLFVSVLSSNRAQAQSWHGLTISKIVELAESDHVTLWQWAKNQGLEAQVVHKGEVTIRHYVPSGAADQAEVDFGLSACNKINSLRGGWGSFRLACKDKYLEVFIQEATKLGFKRDTAPIRLKNITEKNTEDYLYFAPPNDKKQTDSGLYFVVCNGWLELKCVP